MWYLDNSEYVAKCTNCAHYFRREDFPMCVLDEAPKLITNADRIRSMTDEELAEEILSWYNWLNAVEWDDKRIINWLKQES